jgi:hypothetical protein
MPTIPTIGAFSSNNPLFVSHNRSRIQCWASPVRRHWFHCVGRRRARKNTECVCFKTATLIHILSAVEALLPWHRWGHICCRQCRFSSN